MSTFKSEVTLGANITNYVAAFREATAIYRRFNSEISKSSISSTDALAKSSKVVSTAVKASAVAMGALGVAALKTGADFEHQMSRVGAIAGANSKQLKSLNDLAIKLGAQTSFSAKEAAQGMEALASAGFNTNQIMKATPGVLDLAAVSGGDVGAAAEYAATALNGFGLSAKDSTHVADVFARAAADTNAEAKDMGEALKMVAPQAHTAKLSLEETAAAIGLMSNAGIKGSEAGSNLAMALTRVQNPSGEAQKAMAKLGFNAFDSAGKMKPLAQQLSELREKLAGMTDQQKQYYLSEIYGVQGGRAINVLLSQRAGALENLTSKLKNSDGSAKEMAKTMQNDLKSSVEQFFGSLESLSIILEETFSGTLKGAIDGITDKIGQFNDYLQKNQTQIQNATKQAIEFASGFIKMLPSIESVGNALKMVLPMFLALETFKGVGAGAAKTINFLETMQNDLTLVQTGLRVTGSAASVQGKVITTVFGSIAKNSKSALIAFNNFNNQITSANGPAYLAGKFRELGSALTGLPGKASKAGKDLVKFATDPQAAVAKLNSGYASLLTTFGASTKTIGDLTGSAKLLGGSLGSLTIIAAGVAVVASAIYMAWSSNFMNIQGVVKTAIGGIKAMFDSTRPAITAVRTALKPLGTILGGIMKVIGAMAIGAIVVAAIQLATALRLVVDALSAILKVGSSAVNILKAIGLAATGHFKAAGKALADSKKNMGEAKNAVKDMGRAFVDAGKTGYDSFKQLGGAGKSASDSSKAASSSVKQLSTSVKNVANSAKEMKTTFDNSKTKFSELINTDGVSDKTKRFLTNVNNTLTQYQENAQKASDNYKKAITKAEEETGSARIKTLNEANKQLAQATAENGKNLIAISSDLDRQLKEKKFTDGTAMTADQVKMLTEQNNQIKQKLLEQNQVFVDAQLQRVQNGQKLSQQEREATMTTIQADYEMRTQQIKAGEDRIKQLKDAINQAKDQTTKAQLQQELVQQQTHNQQLIAQQQNFGTQMNLAIANGNQLTFQTWSNGLQNMHNVTTEQLQSMFLSFVQMNNDTGQQMQAFALMLQQTGTQGVNNLVQVLSTGKATTTQIAQAIAKDGTDGLNSLPPGMFAKGDEGKNKFIQALKSGDFKGAGKYLADQSASGAKDTKKHGDSGKNNAEAYIKQMENSKSRAKTAAKEVAKSGSEGLKSQKSSYKSAGESNGKNYTSGVKSQNSSARSAGRFLANSAKSGANGVSFYSVGSHMAAGVASGIRGNTGAAVSAMRSLVNQVNAEARRVAKIHSPSRLMRDEVGKYLSLGVAEGISDNEDSALLAMSTLISRIKTGAENLNLRFTNPYENIATELAGDIQVERNTNTHLTVEVPVNIDGREVARVTAEPMQEELNRRQLRTQRLYGNRT